MTARTPKVRAIATEIWNYMMNVTYVMPNQIMPINYIEEKIDNAISQAVNEALEAAMNICDTTYPCNDPAHDDRWCQRCSTMRDHGDLLEQEILKLKAAYAKGEKGE